MKSDTVYWRALEEAQRTRSISIRKIAAKIDRSPSYLSRIFAGKIPCDEKMARQIAGELFDEAGQQDVFVNAALGENERLQVGRRFSVSLVSYGFLTPEDARRKVVLSGKSHMTGPSGFLIDCIGRLMHMMGQDGLERELSRVPLSKLISGAGRPNGEVVLSHLAALNMVATSQFFCTPISVGVSGVLFLGHLKDGNARQLLVKEVRESLRHHNRKHLDQLQLICMEREVGHYFARSLFPMSERQVSPEIEELTPENCRRALESASSRLGRIPVLIADELTCYHVLDQLSDDAALLFGPNTEVPRFYFGFSTSRSDYELRKDLDRVTELYLKSDVHFIVERYCEMHRQLVTFAAGLRDCFGEGWTPEQCLQWADQVCGIDEYATDSTFISNAWRRILNHVQVETRPPSRKSKSRVRKTV
jgi:hypothetical protein